MCKIPQDEMLVLTTLGGHVMPWPLWAPSGGMGRLVPWPWCFLLDSQRRGKAQIGATICARCLLSQQWQGIALHERGNRGGVHGGCTWGCIRKEENSIGWEVWTFLWGWMGASFSWFIYRTSRNKSRQRLTTWLCSQCVFQKGMHVCMYVGG